MKVYLVELPHDNYSYCDDYAMVVIAEDEKHAERKARWSSDNFKSAKKINISEISLDKEDVILKANVGAWTYLNLDFINSGENENEKKNH